MRSADILDIALQFEIPDGKVQVALFGSGHIHQTYLVTVEQVKPLQYILQKINHQVFQDPQAVMSNIDVVLNHLQRSSQLRPLHIIKTKDHQIFWHQADKGYWRMYNYVQNSFALDNIQSDLQAYQGARAYGIFLNELSSLDPSRLAVTIKDFHNLQWRFQQLKQAIKENRASRLHACEEAVNYAIEQEHRMQTLHQLTLDQGLPTLVTHNDTKINNVLFDQNTNEALSVVDLDTVMPGLLMFDFGDMIRTFCNKADEDATADQVSFERPIFITTCEGFFDPFDKAWSELEIVSLSVAPWYMTYIMGIRFLADYLNGDIYYQTHYEDQNLRRSRNQLRLCAYLLEAEPWLKQQIMRKTLQSR